MLLTLSSESVRNTVFTNESGQVLYKTSHPFQLGLVMGTTTIQKIVPNADPMDMRDKLVVMGEIEWRLLGSSTFRINGQEMLSSDFLPSHGIMRRCVPPFLITAFSNRSRSCFRFLQQTDVYGTRWPPISMGYAI